MRDLTKKETEEINGGNFWADITYLAASLYYNDCGSSGGYNPDFSYLRGPKF